MSSIYKKATLFAKIRQEWSITPSVTKRLHHLAPRDDRGVKLYGFCAVFVSIGAHKGMNLGCSALIWV